MRHHVASSSGGASPRLVIVAGDAFTRSCLEALFVELSSGAVSGAAGSRCHVVLIDADSIGIDLRAAVRREVLAGHHVVLLGARLRPAVVRWCLERGVRAVVPKDVSFADVRRVVVHVARGGRHVPPDLAALAVSAPADPLTERERHALQVVASGATTCQAARSLGVAEGTLRNLLSSALRKTGTRDRHSAVAVARDAGWL